MGVIHRSVDAKFLNGLRCGRRQRLTNGQIGRRRSLNYFRSGAAGAGDSGVVDDAGGSDRARGLAIEQIAGVDAVEQKCVAGVALTVGPYRLIAESRVGTGSGGQFGVYSWRKNGEAGEAAGGQRDGINLVRFEDVTVGGVDGVHQRRGLNFYDRPDLADGQRRIDGGCTIGLNGDGRYLLGFETFVSEG